VPGVDRNGSAILPVLSLTTSLQSVWNTQLTFGAATSTILSCCACAEPATLKAAIAAHHVVLRLSISCFGIAFPLEFDWPGNFGRAAPTCDACDRKSRERNGYRRFAE
jgi:hypothetical protein